MNLQLAESYNMSAGYQMSTRGRNHNKNIKPYIYVPGERGKKGIYIREDFFDQLPAGQFHAMMQKLVRHQREVKSGAMSEEEYLGTRADRKARREAKTDKKKAKAELRRSKGQAKIIRAQNKNKGRGQGGGGKKVYDEAKDVALNIFGKKAGSGGGAPDEGEKQPFYKTTAGMVTIIGGSVLLLALGGYALTRKRKK